MSQPSILATRGGTGFELAACGPHDQSRDELEVFVKQAFLRKHGATITSLLPTLMSLRDRAGRLCGVAGYRVATAESLFLEKYLDRPIEDEIERLVGAPVERSTIVEVGNLAAVSCRAARRLAARLPMHLLERGHQWLVFTGTRTVRDILATYGAPLIELGRAEQARIQGTTDDWGSYYDADPRVMVGFLPHSHSLRSFSVDAR